VSFVLWDPLPPSLGPGHDAHCGIEGLDRPPKGNRIAYKNFLDVVAQEAVRIKEADWEKYRLETPVPMLSAAPGTVNRGISRRLVALASMLVILVGLFAGIEIGRRQMKSSQSNNEAPGRAQIERRITEDLSAALDESERIPEPDPPVLPTTSSSTGFVYLGICDSGAWTKSFFGSLPSCEHEQALSVTITARRGTKIRGTLPTAGKFGEEIARLRFGETVRLVRLHPMLGDLPLPGPKVVWGEISL